MRIAFLIKSMNTTGGGAERVLSEVVGGLADQGHRVTLITFDQPGDPSFYPLHAEVDFMQLGIGAANESARVGETLGRMRALRRTIVKLRPDLAIGFMHSGYIPMAAALAGTGVPLVASEHISWDHFVTRPAQAALLRVTPPLVRAITIMSPRVRDGFPPFVRRAMVIVPNPVGVTPAGLADVAGGGLARRTLLTVGRLEPQKDQATLVEAFARLAPRFPDWDLRIVGEGALRSPLEGQIARLGLGGRVTLPGSTSDIGAVYRGAQLFVIPSLYESFGLVTAEAMAHGLPAVGFADCAGTNEVILDGVNGLLVDGPDRADALTDGLASLMRDADARVRLGRAARSAAEPFLPARALEDWDRLLRAVHAGGHWRRGGLPGQSA